MIFPVFTFQAKELRQKYGNVLDILMDIKCENEKIYNYTCKLIKNDSNFRIKIYKNNIIVISEAYKGIPNDEYSLNYGQVYECYYFKKGEQLFFESEKFVFSFYIGKAFMKNRLGTAKFENIDLNICKINYFNEKNSNCFI